MELAELQARLGGLTLAEVIAVPASSSDVAFVAWENLKEAAVLVPVIHGPAPGVLLTVRNSNLSSHAGQVAFPGGRIDPGESPEQAALREAHEEVGLDSGLVEVTGRLPAHITGTGYRVTPVIGLLAPGFVPVPAAAEVAAVFELPMSVLLDPAAPRRERTQFRGRDREFWVWPHEQHYIWGATAAILVKLAQLLRGERVG